MSKQAVQSGELFRAECVWCGALIRLNGTKPSRGMCVKCFARMMREHTRPHRRERPQEASDR
jgi:hypothetical protein